jgi:PhnB protein
MTALTPTPHLVVNNAEAAIKFYETAFGATPTAKHPTEDGKRIMHAALKLGDGAIMLHDDFPEHGDQGAKPPTRLGGVSCTIHLEVPDADSAWQRAMKAGATETMKLDNQFWGQRYGEFKDPFGHLWSIGGPLK